MENRTFTQRLFLLLLCCTCAALPAQVAGTYFARLSGQQQVLPVATPGAGTVTVEIVEASADELSVTVTGSFSGLSAPVATDIGGGAHIHLAYPGSNGAIVLPLTPSLGDDGRSGSFLAEDNKYTVPASDLAGADVGQLYVNVHTSNYPGGEIRGNLLREEVDSYYANLFGSNEVPAVVSTARGAVVASFAPGTNQLIVTGSFTGLADTVATRIGGGAHLHIQLPGRNGGIALPLTATLSEDRRSGTFAGADNTFTLTEEQRTRLQQGRMYANVHSGAFPGGEIRGQLLPPADQLLRAHLAGANEWPMVSTYGSGQVLAHVIGNTVRVIGSFDNLSSAVDRDIAGGTHLHPGYAGENGPVSFPLNVTLNAGNRSGGFQFGGNTYELRDGQRDTLLARGFYLNIHTAAYPTGEIRGQLLPESQAVFTAFLNGNQQIPSVTTTGRGMVKLELNGTRLTASGSYTGLESDLNRAIAGGAHLHAGYPGQSGPVIYPLTINGTGDGEEEATAARSGYFLADSNIITLGEATSDTLLDRFFYVNVHTQDRPGGEIRGAVLAEAERYYLAPLSGASQPDHVETMATGYLAAEVTDTVITLVGSFTGLESDFAAGVAGGMHIHEAIAGSNGGIVTPINTELAEDLRGGEILADSNRLRLTAAQITALRDRRLYANVHTADYPAGAIRGQWLPLAGSYFHTTFSGVNATDYVTTTAEGGLKLELNDSTLYLSGSVTMLEGDFDASIAGGAHLHLAPAGANGGIVLPISGMPGEDDLKTVVFAADSNRYVLPDSVETALRTGRLYANVHTTTVPGGEARGQLLGELNLPPAMSQLRTPADGAELLLEGGTNQNLRVSYQPVTDPDQDSVIYIWQLATDADFTDVVFAINTGRDTFFSVTYGAVDTLLAGAGVPAEGTVELYHRVLASDGSNYTTGTGATISLTRGELTGTRDFRPRGFAARVYPNPGRGNAQLQYELRTDEAFGGRLYLHTALGQLRGEWPVTARPGTQNLPLSTTGLPAGQYFLTLRAVDGRLVEALRVVLQ